MNSTKPPSPRDAFSVQITLESAELAIIHDALQEAARTAMAKACEHPPGSAARAAGNEQHQAIMRTKNALDARTQRAMNNAAKEALGWPIA